MPKKKRRSIAKRARRARPRSRLESLLVDLNLVGRARAGVVARPRLAALGGKALLLTLDPDLPGDQLDNLNSLCWLDPEPLRVRLKAFAAPWSGQGLMSIRRALGRLPPGRHPTISALGGIALCYLGETISRSNTWAIVDELNQLAAAPIELPERVRDLVRRFSEILKALELEHEKRIDPCQPLPIEAVLPEHEVYDLLAPAFEEAARTLPPCPGVEIPPSPARRGRLPKNGSQVELVVAILKSAESPLSAKQIGAEAKRRNREIGNVRSALSRASERYRNCLLRATDAEGDRVFVWVPEPLPQNAPECPNSSAANSGAIRGI